MARTLVSVAENKRRNYLVNGNFDFFQRGTSLTTSGDVAYKADRWRSNQSNSITHSRESTGAHINSSFYYRLTFGTNSYTHLAQYLEAPTAKLLAGKTVTFSFLLRKSSSYVGTVTMLIEKNSTPNTSSGGSWSSVGSSLIANADIPTRVPSSSDWVRFSLTVTIPSDGTAAGLSFGLITNVASQTNGAILEVSQVMLNEGSVASPFSLFAENYSQELRVCQRYYEKSFPVDFNPGTLSAANGNSWASNISSGSTRVHLGRGNAAFKVTKRADNNTFRIFNHRGDFAENKISVYNGDTNQSIVTSNATANQNGFDGYLDALANDTVWGFHWTVDSEIN